ncbi:hypothetical protein [Cryobacterium sp. TMT2-42-4]|uniref:hypothetical protein n=1 Tax=Cryobacterium sp. TMT2-42-4 TaxID=1259255 RepID=UPI001068E822|nr:hypothetical protein [Cryobacterium sp. TMT2-42-4]TFC35447.1 hypothetical protein E3O18_10025 [Cryobacterium sp. TMT2-42-4]
MPDEQGSTLLAVIGVMAVTAIIALTVTAATLNGISATSSARASVQSRAAAEAGIDVTMVSLQVATGPESCSSRSGLYDSVTGTVPKYSTKVQIDPGSGWVTGCPTSASTKVKIISTGFAQANGVSGASSGDDSVLEAVYTYIPAQITIPTIGSAVYAHTISGVLKNFTLDSAVNTVAADVQIKNGNAICTNGAKISGNLILGNGYAALDNCTVSGTVHVSNYVTLNGGASLVQGDVIAAGQAAGPVTGFVVAIANGAKVNGSLLSNGNVSVTSSPGSTVNGNVTVAGTPASVATVANNSTVNGYVQSSGTIANDGNIVGAKTQNVTGLVSPPVPLVPNWSEIPYPTPFSSTTWAAQGFQELVWNGPCVISGVDPSWTALSNLTVPTVVNTLAKCGAAGLSTDSNVKTLTLKTNVAFAAHQFNFGKLNVLSSDTTARRLWFYVPDPNSADGVPTCVAPAGNITMSNETDIDGLVSVMAYTPCKFYSNRDGWRGQIYGGEVEFGQQAKLTFVPVGVPGVSLSGIPYTPPVPAHLGVRTSLRDLVTGG